MTRPTDEDLMAYADDGLDPAARARVEAHLATDTEASARVEMFRNTAALARDAFAAPLHEPVPEALIQAILKAPAPAGSTAEPTSTKPSSAEVVDLASRRQSPRSADTWRLSLAASLALLVGLGTGYLSGRSTSVQSGDEISLGAVERSTSLADVLEHQQSGAQKGRHLVVATFRDQQNRVCREIELMRMVQPERPEIAAVACRTGGGSWTIEGAARIASPAPARGEIEPSGVVERDALESLLNMLGAKPVLSTAEEKTLIERGWK